MALQKLNQDEEIHLTFTVSQILENWELDDNIQLSLLGLEDKINPDTYINIVMEIFLLISIKI